MRVKMVLQSCCRFVKSIEIRNRTRWEDRSLDAARV